MQQCAGLQRGCGVGRGVAGGKEMAGAPYLDEEEEDGTRRRSFLSIEQLPRYLGAIGR